MLQIKPSIEKTFAPGFWKRSLQFWKYYVEGFIKRSDEQHLFLSGAGIAFSLLLSFIPFILVVFSLFSSLIRQDIIELFINRWVDAIIPYSEYAEFVKRALMNRLPDIVAYKAWAGWLGIIGFIFSASTLFTGMRTILNKIFCVVKGRSALFGLLRDMGMVVILLFFVLLSTLALPLYDVIAESAGSLTVLQNYNIGRIYEPLVKLSSIAFIFAMFFLVYAMIPYERLDRKIPAISAAWATLFWEISRNIFAYYAKNFISTNKLYGAFGLVVVVLLWVYFLSMIFLIGAVIGQLYREKKLKPLKQVKK
jgi:membrane protein